MVGKKKLRLLCCRQSKSLAAPLMSLADVESLTMPLVQTIILSADFRCADCQSRVNHVFSKLDAATGSMVFDAWEKRVTLISRVTRGRGTSWHGDPFQPSCCLREFVEKIFTIFKSL